MFEREGWNPMTKQKLFWLPVALAVMVGCSGNKEATSEQAAPASSAVAEDAGAACSEVASLFPLQPTMTANATGSQKSFCLVIGFHPSLSNMNLSPAAETHRHGPAGSCDV